MTLRHERLEGRALMSGNDPEIRPVTLVEIAAADTLVESESRIWAVDEALTVVPRPFFPHVVWGTPLIGFVGRPASGSAGATLAASRFGSQAAREAWLVEAAADRWEHLFGKPVEHQRRFHNMLRVVPDVFGLDVSQARFAPASFMGQTTATAAATSGSQEAGVDESDLVESDGRTLYMLSGRSLVVVGGLDSGRPAVVARIELDPFERPVGLYLSGSRLAVVSSAGAVGRSWCGWPRHPFGHDEEQTVVTVLDVSDRLQPTLVQRTSMDGVLVTSRVVDGELRLVLKNGFELPPVAVMPVLQSPPASDQWDAGTFVEPIRLGQRERQESRFETREEYIARIRTGLVEATTPMMRRLDAAGHVLEEIALVAAGDVWGGCPDGVRNLAVLARFDLQGDGAGPMGTVGTFTSDDLQVYATSESIYLFDGQAGLSGSHTRVQQFTFPASSPGIERRAQGHFEGRLLNQWAVDEHDQRLRVVVEGLEDGHGVFVLERSGEALEVTGRLTGLGRGESLYAVRFAGARAYIVTFRQTDPLYVVGFADSATPELLGELQLPGFSDFLMPIDDNHLLAIGRHIDGTGWTIGDLQMSLFDVTDPHDPRLVDRHCFADGQAKTTPVTGNLWTRGDGDSMALEYYSESGVITLPVENLFPGSWQAAASADDAGLYAFRVDPQSGFTHLGIIRHGELVKRSLEVASHLVAISPDAVSVHDMENPEVCLGEVRLDGAGGIPLHEVPGYPRTTALARPTADSGKAAMGAVPPGSGRTPHPIDAARLAWMTLAYDLEGQATAEGNRSSSGMPKRRIAR